MRSNNEIWIYPLVVMAFVLILTNGCKEADDNKDADTATDIDGNVYKTVKIGTQVWMDENLKVTKYRNGDAIPQVTDDTQWSNLKTGAYCNYGNSTSNAATYGRLYNWYAVNTGGNLCPAGWHLPTDAEWTTLTTYLGGESVAGGKLKEVGTAHWASPNTGATNETGFSALPGGYRRYSNGDFVALGNYSYCWSSTEYDATRAWVRYMINDNKSVYRSNLDKAYGFYVRCVRDN